MAVIAIIVNDTVTENNTTGNTSSIGHQLGHALRTDDKDAVSFLHNTLKYSPQKRIFAKQCMLHKFLLTKGE